MADELGALMETVTADVEAAPAVDDVGSAPSFTERSPAPPGEPLPPSEIPVPVSWAKEKHAHWGTFSREAQEYIAQRETEAQRRISELGASAKAQEAIGGVFQQFADVIPQHLAPHETIAHLLTAHRMLEENPEWVISYLAQQYGLDLGSLDSNGATRVRELEQRALRAESALRHHFSERQEAEAKRAKEENARRVKEAKKFQAINQRPGHGASPVKGSIEDSIREVADRLMPG
jgi:hypothetical protein